MLETLRTRFGREDGATAVEYGIMVALIAVVIIVAVSALGTNLSSMFQETANCVGDNTHADCPSS